MTEKLKPCPFCGRQAEVRLIEDFLFGELYAIECDFCGARQHSWKDKAKAIEAWNKRSDNE